jgi:hypothetical protein
MSGDAILMMLLAMIIIWGGLIVAILNLRRGPDLSAEQAPRRDL